MLSQHNPAQNPTNHRPYCRPKGLSRRRFTHICPLYQKNQRNLPFLLSSSPLLQLQVCIIRKGSPPQICTKEGRAQLFPRKGMTRRPHVRDYTRKVWSASIRAQERVASWICIMVLIGGEDADGRLNGYREVSIWRFRLSGDLCGKSLVQYFFIRLRAAMPTMVTTPCGDQLELMRPHNSDAGHYQNMLHGFAAFG